MTSRHLISGALVMLCALAGKGYAEGPPAGFLQESLGDSPFFENQLEGLPVDRDMVAGSVAPGNSNIIYLATPGGTVYFTHDGGESWHRSAISSEPNQIRLFSGGQLRLRVPDYPEFFGWPQLPDRAWSAANIFEFMEPATKDAERLIDLGPSEPGEIGIELPDTSMTVGTPLGEQTFVRSDKFPSGWIEGGPRAAGGRWITRRGSHGFSRPLTPSVVPQDLELPSKASIRRIHVNSSDPYDAVLSTTDGVYRTLDGGWTWHREMDRTKFSRRNVRDIHWDQSDPDTRYYCTQHGLSVTRDDGQSIHRVDDPVIRRLPCYWVTANPNDQDEVWVGTVFGSWVSQNSGARFRLNFFRYLDGWRTIKKIRFFPGDPDHVILAADEVIFVSRDHGKTYRISGRSRFFTQHLEDVEFGRQPGHLLAATDRDLWVSTDFGETWRMGLFGNTGWELEKILTRRGENFDVWLLNRTELLKLTREPVKHSSVPPGEPDFVEDEPTMTEVLMAALKRHDVYRGDLRRYRERASSSYYWPELQAGVYARQISLDYGLGQVLLGEAEPGGPFWPPTLTTDGRVSDWHIGAEADWRFYELVAAPKEIPADIDFKRNKRLADQLRRWVRVIYAERRRLQLRGVYGMDEDARAALLRRMRIRELTHYLDILSGQKFTEQFHSANLKN